MFPKPTLDSCNVPMAIGPWDCYVCGMGTTRAAIGQIARLKPYVIKHKLTVRNPEGTQKAHPVCLRNLEGTIVLLERRPVVHRECGCVPPTFCARCY